MSMRVGMNSGDERFGAKGRDVYTARMKPERFKRVDIGGACWSLRLSVRKDEMSGSVTRV